RSRGPGQRGDRRPATHPPPRPAAAPGAPLQVLRRGEPGERGGVAMARPIWSGTISFGLVNVPVKLFSATSPKEVRFHMLHDEDGARIQQKRVCSIDGEEVSWEHIVKGFEVSKGRYVTVTREELDAFAPKATRSIDIEDVVDLQRIDPIYYDHSYYLVPDRGAARPYALLREAMVSTGKVGIGQFVLRTKQYLAAVRPMGKALALSTLLHADE